MKSLNGFPSFNLLVTIACLLPALPLRAGEIPDQSTVDGISPITAPGDRPSPSEDLGYDFVNGERRKIARIHAVTPVAVFVIHEGGKSGRNIPRQELPAQLRSRFPYDASAVALYEKQQAELAAAQRAAARTALRQRESEVLNEIAVLTEQDVAIQKQKGILRHLPPGNGRRVKAAHLDNQQQDIRERVLKLRGQLEVIQARRNAMP